MSVPSAGSGWLCANSACPERKPINQPDPPTCYTCGEKMGVLTALAPAFEPTFPKANLNTYDPNNVKVTFQGKELVGATGGFVTVTPEDIKQKAVDAWRASHAKMSMAIGTSVHKDIQKAIDTAYAKLTDIKGKTPVVTVRTAPVESLSDYVSDPMSSRYGQRNTLDEVAEDLYGLARYPRTAAERLREAILSHRNTESCWVHVFEPGHVRVRVTHAPTLSSTRLSTYNRQVIDIVRANVACGFAWTLDISFILCGMQYTERFHQDHRPAELTVSSLNSPALE